jgi:uncharacterized protein
MDIEGLRARAAAGSCVAQTVLGICYLDGIEVGVDYAEAFRLLTSASEMGAPRAVLNLARMYAQGLGVSRDTRRAIQLYEFAAERGEFCAQTALGRIYATDEGVGIDEGAARRWYEAAVAQADTRSVRFDDPELEEARLFLRRSGGEAK